MLTLTAVPTTTAVTITTCEPTPAPYQVTDEMFIDAMHKAVALRGEDYIYPREHDNNSVRLGYRSLSGACMYRNRLTDEPSCLIGLALSLIDPALCPDASLVGGASGVIQMNPRTASISDRVAFAADYAQMAQDNGATWGHALERFVDSI